MHRSVAPWNASWASHGKKSPARHSDLRTRCRRFLPDPPASPRRHECSSAFTLAEVSGCRMLMPSSSSRHANIRHACSESEDMNEYSQPGFGKISVHGNGMGVPTPELVEKRAREIAMINEREPDEYTDADWDQAQRELSGTETVAAADDTDEV